MQVHMDLTSDYICSILLYLKRLCYIYSLMLFLSQFYKCVEMERNISTEPFRKAKKKKGMHVCCGV